MRRKKLSRFIALAVMVTVLTGSISGFAETENNQEALDTSTPKEVEYSNEMIGRNYTVVKNNYTYGIYSGEKQEYSIEEAYVEGSDGSLTADNYEYKNKVLNLELGDTGSLLIRAPEDARYYISFDYLSYSESILPVQMSLVLNGEVPFYEARRLVFESTWVDKGESSYDRYGNEIVSVPEKLIQWEHKYLMDASYRYSEPLALELKKGENRIDLTVSEGSLLLGNIYLDSGWEHSEYKKEEAAGGEALIVLEAEDMAYRNDSSIRPSSEFDTALTPYKTSHKVLNVLDGASFKETGQSVTYEFTVKEQGYYNIGFAYKQSDKTDFPVFGDIRIDGEIPAAVFKAYPFAYSRSYKNLVVKDADAENVSIYLEAGDHTLSLTINGDNTRHVLEAVDRIMSEINDLTLEITKVAGKNKDKYRDLDLVKYIPDVQERLIHWADQLDALQDSIKQYNPKVKKIAAFSSLSIASNRLRSLAKEPNHIPYRINELAQSSNSVIQYLANLIDIVNRNALSLDKIYIFQEEAKLPKGAGVFKSIYLNTARFFSSFTNQSYSLANVNKEHLQVWVNRSRQHVEILQKMIDESFTPKTGIKVDISIMPDQNKLVLANASGDAPDVAASINYSIPFELGIRGAIKDLTEFEDYKEVLSRNVEGLLIPAVIGDGIYAVPETINFWVLYYRTDILSKLGLEVPDTIDEVKEMLPELQMRGLNFYYPTAGMSSLKTFHGTTPLLFQHGASLYGKTAGNTAVNSDAAIRGLTELTELFTVYNLPVDVPSFYQHFRNGDMPIGIAEYNMYNLLTNAAPEIANSWDIALLPGVKGEDGEIKRYASGGAESCVIFNSTQEREDMAWEYLKWWTNKDTQIEFGQTLQITYGDEYIWNTANVEAFLELPWKSEDKKVILKQTEWMLEAPRILGTYMLERELSNSYNKVVVDGKDLRITIDSAVKRINRETERKLMEFGYLSADGREIKEYLVPDLKTVRQILNGE
ncbi:ABC transporter substrate-binding protein [Anaerocolumna cellulosilytica]|uniref:ABC transporter substrate-binding protein n=1 Tax=Anaerocolumna cellulosilytica TaxID=433286 RepID=A0A6S6R8M5_9FIRM|nr:extracellular solute-binding protein [Anaerocolumna cellulosilytica]MBB5197089.1 ABC-type glycerol-3-phosphate transport system substrate-binding protein [Anaerocolumna cellulosilytica]BCJ95301.1 ABC transporter substrate-binding protein [Anaerocolumna cellulosilytica]